MPVKPKRKGWVRRAAELNAVEHPHDEVNQKHSLDEVVIALDGFDQDFVDELSSFREETGH